jgi:hypothetical protein
MNYSIASLHEKIRSFHPEIERNKIDLSLTWDEAHRRYAIQLSKTGQAVGAYLDQKDADECMSGKKCLNLAVMVTQSLAELEEAITPRKPG